jgi:hypothetical protein
VHPKPPAALPCIQKRLAPGDEELCEIFMGMMAADKSGFKLEDERWARIATRRWGVVQVLSGSSLPPVYATRHSGFFVASKSGHSL